MADRLTQLQDCLDDLPDPSNTEEPVPDSPEVFQAALRELARDLIMKEQQIEHLIGVLPGIVTSLVCLGKFVEVHCVRLPIPFRGGPSVGVALVVALPNLAQSALDQYCALVYSRTWRLNTCHLAR
ncbi:Mediator of RNA polymerase II transcription subunit 21 [Zalaria obscura]|uniref:Mediator of RNA polymerase II transcription subunit 21 n=1 Tax=Zalaria obscura TaxID=2024903 RepID=A0ACC3SKL9_9PEZI